MKTIAALITRAGGFAAVQRRYINITNEPYMRLVVEVVSGPYPDGSHEVSVAHYGKQNGDAMRDPEILYHVGPDPLNPGKTLWRPLFIQQDYLGQYDVCAVTKPDGTYFLKNERLARSISSFAVQWDRNIARQGFAAAFNPQPLEVVTP